MTVPDDAAAGVTLAQRMLVALAHDDDEAVLRAINAASDGEVRWACATLARVVQSTVSAAMPNLRETRAALLASAEAMSQDAVVAAVEVILEQEGRHG